MSIQKLIDNLKKLKEEDVVDFGEDYEGNPVFLIRNISSSAAQLTLGKFSTEELSDWSEV